jgi:alpha-beta hydrolase superfamily lysophospholipase
VAEALAAHGIACWAPDHLGHGNSPGPRCHIDRFGDYFGPLDELRSLITDTCPDLPCFIIGHSLGGLIVGNYLLEHQSRFAGAVFSGAAFAVPKPPGAVAVFVNKLIAALFPKFGVLQLDASEVSRDPEVVRRYREDPLVHSGKVSARLVVELFSSMASLAEKCSNLTLPVLVMHGGADVMTPPGGSHDFVDNIGATDKTLNIYPKLYHEIFNEPEQAAVLTELCDWLEAHFGPTQMTREDEKQEI